MNLGRYSEYLEYNYTSIKVFVYNYYLNVHIILYQENRLSMLITPYKYTPQRLISADTEGDATPTLYLEVKTYGVYRDHCLPSIVLQSPCQEGLRKKETRYPEHRWNTLFNPTLYKLHSFLEVHHPGCQWFERGISL